LQKERARLIEELDKIDENGCMDTITKFKDNYYDYNSEFLYSHNQIPKKYFLIELDTLGSSLDNHNKTVTLNIAKNIKLKKGRYFYTTTDTVRISIKNKFGNYYRYVDIPFRFEYNINYNGNEYENCTVFRFIQSSPYRSRRFGELCG